MLPAWTALAEEPISAIPAADDVSVPAKLPFLLADPNADLIFLLEATPLALTGPESAFPYAVAEEPMAALATGESATDQKVRLSDRGYVTKPSESPASTPYRPRLLTPYSYEIELPLPGDVNALGRAGFGLIEMANDDHELDDLLGRSWEGREVRVLVGGTYNVGRSDEYSLAFNEFGLRLRATASALASERGLIILALLENMAKLDKPIQTVLYDGTGGTEGGAGIEGLQKPLCFGRCFNVSPVLVDDVNLIYQVHDGSIEAIAAVRDKGLALTADGDFPGLTGWTPVGGRFVTDLAAGMFRVGGAPSGQITADVDGDNTGGWVTSTPDIVRRIATRYGGLVDPSEIHAASFAAFPNTQMVGYYTGTRELLVTVILNQLLTAADGWLAGTHKGRLQIGAFKTPEDETPAAELSDIVLREVADEYAPDPIWRMRVGYQPMWTVQDEDALAGAVSAADRALYSQEHRYATAENPNTRSKHRSARDVEMPTFFVEQSAAQVIATAKLLRLMDRRRTYRADVEQALFQHQVGEVVRVTASDGDLSGGRKLWIHRLAEVGADRSVQLGLWG